MASRYGRKQRRQHRERIAALEDEVAAAWARESRALARAASLDNEMHNWDEEIRRLLGAYSAFRRTTPEMTSPYPIREMPIMDRVRPFAYSDRIEMDALPCRERISRFVLSLDRDDVSLQRLIRFMESDGKGGVAYAMSEHALKHGMGRREVEYLFRSIAENMVKHWNGRAT